MNFPRRALTEIRQSLSRSSWLPRPLSSARHERDDLAGCSTGAGNICLMIANEVIGPELQAKFGPLTSSRTRFWRRNGTWAFFEVRATARCVRGCGRSWNAAWPTSGASYLATEMRAANREVTLDAISGRVRRRDRVSQEPGAVPEQPCCSQRVECRSGTGAERLPEHYRQAVASRHIEQLSWDEIGRRMNCSADAARKVWSRAIQQLRRELANHESIP